MLEEIILFSKYFVMADMEKKKRWKKEEGEEFKCRT